MLINGVDTLLKDPALLRGVGRVGVVTNQVAFLCVFDLNCFADDSEIRLTLVLQTQGMHDSLWASHCRRCCFGLSAMRRRIGCGQ